MGLHHQTLKAAVALYAILLTQGKAEAEIKAEIAKDPKEFSPEEITEIYDAILEDAKKAAVDAESKLERLLEVIIASNKEVIASNQLFIDKVSKFFEGAEKLSTQTSGNQKPTIQIAEETGLEDFDPKADYVVCEGRTFRDPQDFAKIYRGGDEVKGLSNDKLQNLFVQGLIEEA